MIEMDTETGSVCYLLTGTEKEIGKAEILAILNKLEYEILND